MTQLDTNWDYCGLKVVRPENDFIRLDLLPEAGAKIYNFIHKPSGKICSGTTRIFFRPATPSVPASTTTGPAAGTS